MKIQAINFSLDKKLALLIEQKVSKLDNFYDGITKGEVFLRIGNEASENKAAEVRLLVPGKELFAKGNSLSFEASIQRALGALKKQLQRVKQKQNRS